MQPGRRPDLFLQPSPGRSRWSIWPGLLAAELQAGIIRLERNTRPEGLNPSIRAFCLGLVAVVGVQFLFVGSAYPWFPCNAFADIAGALLIGLAPLMLAYLVVAALATLLASSPEV